MRSAQPSPSSFTETRQHAAVPGEAESRDGLGREAGSELPADSARRAAAFECLEGFLDRHAGVIHDYRNVPVEQSGLFRELGSRSAEFTHFDDLYDTLLYARTIARSLDYFDAGSEADAGGRQPDQSGAGDLILDLGAGSSLPTLLALSRRELNHVRVLAVDIDPEAEAVGRANARRFGLEENYQFLHAPIESVLKELEAVLLRERAGRTLIVSNPPFIPVPVEARDHHLVPVDGGEDGSHYLRNILQRHYPPNTALALVWGSLTSPLEVLPLIEDHYQVRHLEAMRVHFARYTSLPAVRDHLHALRRTGDTVFDTDPQHGDSQIVMGAVLRPA